MTRPRTSRGDFSSLAILARGAVALSLLTAATSGVAQDTATSSLRKALTLHASFDREPDADHARGDRSIWSAPALNKREAAVKGLPAGGEVKLETEGGRFGGALRFLKSAGPMVFFRAEKNFPQPAPGWGGAVSFWLSVEPAKDLPDGYCDPLQVTSKQWDDASFFVEFEKRPAGIPFRLGVYADRAVWNPRGRKWEEIPVGEKPLTAVEKPPFAGDRWTHVAFSFHKFNSGAADGAVALFLNGRPSGDISPRTQTFTWDASRAAIMLGLGYVGRMDDLAVFDRALSADEVATLFALKQGVAELRAAGN